MIPALTGTGWLPAIDIFRDDGHLVIKVDLPGMTKDDVEVSLENGFLVVRAERPGETELKEASYRSERPCGSFFRRVPLPIEVNADEMAANIAEGVLEVRIPLRGARREVKRISVAAAR
jgi:HSP20 family protein